MTTVLCIVAGNKDAPKAIPARECVEAQRSNRCFCMKSVPALQAVAPDFEPADDDSGEALSKKRKGREDLVMLKARCTGFLRKRPSEQYAGPAIAAAQGRSVEQPLSSSVPLPAPPKRNPHEKPSIGEPWGKTAPRDSKTGGASMPPGPGKPAHPEPDEREDEHEAAIAAREFGPVDQPLVQRAQRRRERHLEIEREIEESLARPLPARKPPEASAPPEQPKGRAAATKEKKPMTQKLTDRECEWKEEPCSNKLGPHNKSGHCARHGSVMRLRVIRAKAGKKPRQPPPRAQRAPQKPELVVPADPPKVFPGMPAFAEVPIGWVVGFLKFLRDQSVAVDGIGATGT